MAKITRVKQLLFGSTGDAGDFGQPGSINTTKTNTKDPSVIQALSSFLAGLASIVPTGTYKVALEDLNSLFLLAFYQISYIMQAGVPEWDSATTYYTGSLVNVSGNIYKSLSDDNLNNDPASTSGYWTMVSGTPIGSTQDFCGPLANIPAGYLHCDGAAISRTTYAALFSAIGTAWGTGDGSTTFNLPDFRGSFAVGYKSTDTDLNAVGKTGGEKTHVLTAAEMPSHTHTIGIGNVLGGNGPYVEHSTSDSQGVGTTNPTGGGQAHNNMPPFGVVLKIIKY